MLFDIDDTLIDFGGAARRALLDVAVALGGSSRRQTGEQVLRSWAAVSEPEYDRFLAGEVTFEEMLVARMAALIDHLDPTGTLSLDPVELERLRGEAIFTHYRQYADVPPCLARLGSAGIAVGAVSNSDGAYQRRKMAAAGLDQLIDRAVFSGDLGVSKPDPAIFLAGAAALGLPAGRVVYVGDRWATDALGALGAGLAAVWLNRPGLPRPAASVRQLAAVPRSAARLTELPDLEPLGADLVLALLSD